MSPPYSFLQAVADVTLFSDSDLATIIGIPRSTVHAYRSGRLAEHLDGRQVKALKTAARLLRDKLIVGCDELDLLS